MLALESALYPGHRIGQPRFTFNLAFEAHTPGISHQVWHVVYRLVVINLEDDEL